MIIDELRKLADNPTLCGEGMVDTIRAAADSWEADKLLLRDYRIHAMKLAQQIEKLTLQAEGLKALLLEMPSEN